MDSSFLQRSGWARALDGNGAQLGSVAIAATEPDRPLVIRGKTTSRHPDTTTLDVVGHAVTFGSESLDNLTGGLVPTNNPTSEVVLDTVRGKSGVDEVASLEQARTLVMDTTSEHANVAVAGHGALQVDREIGLLLKGININGMDVVSTVVSALSCGTTILVQVCLGRQVQCLSVGVDDTGGSDTNERRDVDATVQIVGIKGNM